MAGSGKLSTAAKGLLWRLAKLLSRLPRAPRGQHAPTTAAPGRAGAVKLSPEPRSSPVAPAKLDQKTPRLSQSGAVALAAPSP